jgi:FkbM family methyltransferase
VIPHHPVFSKFTPFKGEAAAGFDRDFIGSKIRRMFWTDSPRDTTIEVETSYPSFDEEYFEWVDLLEAVAAARDSYTMIELGAGYGRWSVRAALAVQRYWSTSVGGMPFQLIAVEADPVHFDWLGMHFEANGVAPTQQRLLHAAVGNIPGKASLWIGSDESHTPQEWYGQMVHGAEKGERVKGANYGGYEVRRHPDGRKSISVPQVTLASLLKDLGRVDLIDCDIQGLELNAMLPAMDELNAKVKRVHIGTHSFVPGVEVGLRTLFTQNGWQCLGDYPGRGVRATPYGEIEFDDGVQSWINPRI